MRFNTLRYRDRDFGNTSIEALMTIYGENDFQFRPAPSTLALFSAATALLLLCAELANALVGLMHLLLARAAGLVAPVVFYVPFLGNPRMPFYSAPPLGPLYDFATPIVVAVSALLVVALIHLWPTEQRLAIRLFIHAMALSLVLTGCLAPSFDLSSFDGLTAFAPVPPLAWAALFIALGIWLAISVERQTIVLLSNLFSMATPAQRLRHWVVRVPVAMILLAAIAFLGGFSAGAFAAVAVLLATLLENISRRPRERYQLVDHPEMREAAATLPIVAAVILGAVIFAFGFPALRGDSRALVLSGRGVSLESVRTIRSNHPLKLDLIRAGDKRDGASQEEIDIHWTKDRGKAKPQVKPKR